MNQEKIMDWAVRFIGCMDPEIRNDGVIESAMMHADNVRKDLHDLHANPRSIREELNRWMEHCLSELHAATDRDQRDGLEAAYLKIEQARNAILLLEKRKANTAGQTPAAQEKHHE